MYRRADIPTRKQRTTNKEQINAPTNQRLNNKKNQKNSYICSMHKKIRFIGTSFLLLLMLLTGLNIVVQRHYCLEKNETDFHFFTYNHSCAQEEEQMCSSTVPTCCSTQDKDEHKEKLVPTCCDIDYGVLHISNDYTPFSPLEVFTPDFISDVCESKERFDVLTYERTYSFTALPPPLRASVYRAQIQVYLL